MTTLGDSDEDNAEKQMDAQEPQAQRGGTLGHRNDKNAKPLVSIDDLSPALRTDEIVGAEVRSSDDKIIGEVRNLVLDFRNYHDYAIVASGGSLHTREEKHRRSDPSVESFAKPRKLFCLHA